MNISNTIAPRASSNNRDMAGFLVIAKTVAIIAIGLICSACSVTPVNAPAPADVSIPSAAAPSTSIRSGDAAPLPLAILRSKSRWTPVRWAELPGFEEDQLSDGWNAWLKSCERPGPVFAPLCSEARRLSIATGEEQRIWMMRKLQPFRVESLQGSADGLLTSYYEPVLRASRQSGNGFEVPLYKVPAGFGSRKPWYSRQDIDTLPEARSALRGREIAYVADPIDALVLHIQGSGRLAITEPDGALRTVRVAFAGSNDQPYRSVNQWLLAQGVTRINPWPDATKAWAVQNPQRLQQLLWSNPRFIFFREEALSELDAAFGPKGAQGVALTPGRSIAVDPGSIPYGTPVWLASRGMAGNLQRLVFAQDTGSAILGAVRADYFAGTGPEAGEFAARMNQPLKLWVLWPK